MDDTERLLKEKMNEGWNIGIECKGKVEVMNLRMKLLLRKYELYLVMIILYLNME